MMGSPMLSAKKILHYQRLEKFIQDRIGSDIYPEKPQEPHISITKLMIEKTEKYKKVSGSKILDAGCGQGFALEVFCQKGGKCIVVTLGEDYSICKRKGLDVFEMDQSFLEFEAESFDIIWSRHAIEHSLFPLFTLDGFYSALKNEGVLYVEVPSPSTSARHEANPNHYSCFTGKVWASLFEKAKFRILEAFNIRFEVPCGEDLYHAFWLKKLPLTERQSKGDN